MKSRIRSIVAPVMAAAILAVSGTAIAAAAQAAPQAATPKPTIVLVHGAFADSSSWSKEIPVLQKEGYTVIAVANPLRNVGSDAAYLESVLQTIPGPIVLVGHSYAGFIISQAAAEVSNIKALVYVAAYIPMQGESPADLTYMFPGSELTGSNLVTRAEPTGTDLYIDPATFGRVYAGALSEGEIDLAAAVQDPIQASALSDPATVNPPPSIPKWEIVALEDNAIPTHAEFYMAQRVGATIVTTHSGHDVPQARPRVVVDTILQAARSIARGAPAP